MTALDPAVTAWEAWDEACLTRARRDATTQLRLLGVRVIAMHDALKALAEEVGLDWQTIQHDATVNRRAGMHVRDALTVACRLDQAAAA